MFDIIPKAPLLPVKKRNKLHDFTQFYIILLQLVFQFAQTLNKFCITK